MKAGLESLRGALERGGLLTSETDLAVYSYDGALERARPDAVALPRTAEEVLRLVAACAREGIAFTARGAGTNLSGGCIPLRGGLVVSLARLDRIHSADASGGAAVVEPGVVNLRLQKELERFGHFYAPDPASYRVSTLGGNVAENAGGPRCLKYGTTTHHVLALECVLPDGSLERFSLDDPGPEIVSLLVGAEGTLGVVTRAWLRALPEPAALRTFLAAFSSIDAAVECVSAVVAAGVVPRVLEALDRVTVESVEAYCAAGYPRAEAVLLVELDGPEDEVASDAELVERLCRERGAVDFRAAADPAQRERLWEGRRGAYAAMARLAPNVLVEDGVVPRDKLPAVVRRIQEVCGRHSLTAGLLFHAGDGNIHPNIAFDERDAALTRRVKEAGREILQACVELGGSLSGEHGIGSDKRAAMAWLFSKETLDLLRRIKKAIDPLDLANPDKLFPLAGESEGPGYRKPSGPALSPAARHLADKVREAAAEGRGMAVVGTGSRLRERPKGLVELVTAGLNSFADLDRPNLTLTMEAGVSVHELHQSLQRQGLYVRLPESGGTLGGLLAAKAGPALRDDLLGMRVLLADGSVVELGGKVVKNVAGYDVPRLMLGSWGTFGLILDVTLKMYARPQPRLAVYPSPKPFAPGFWHRRLKEAFDPRNLLNPWIFGPEAGS